MSLLLALMLSTFTCTIGCSVDLWDLCPFNGTKWTLPSPGNYSHENGNNFINDAISSWKIYSSTVGKQCCVIFWRRSPNNPHPSGDLTQCASNGTTHEQSCAPWNDNQVSTVTVTQISMPTAQPTRAPINDPSVEPTMEPSTRHPTPHDAVVTDYEISIDINDCGNDDDTQCELDEDTLQAVIDATLSVQSETVYIQIVEITYEEDRVVVWLTATTSKDNVLET
eukprot:228303_1